MTPRSAIARSLGREPQRIGPVGSAVALKLALNHLIAAETSAFALSLELVQRSGVAVETFMAILRESALYAPTFDKKLPRLLKRDYHHPNFSTRHLLKDLRLCCQEARAALFLFTYSLRIDAGPVYSVLFTGGVRNGVGLSRRVVSGTRDSLRPAHVHASFVEPLTDAEDSKPNDRPARLRSADR